MDVDERSRQLCDDDYPTPPVGDGRAPFQRGRRRRWPHEQTGDQRNKDGEKRDVECAHRTGPGPVTSLLVVSVGVTDCQSSWAFWMTVVATTSTPALSRLE